MCGPGGALTKVLLLELAGQVTLDEGGLAWGGCVDVGGTGQDVDLVVTRRRRELGDRRSGRKGGRVRYDVRGAVWAWHSPVPPSPTRMSLKVGV